MNIYINWYQSHQRGSAAGGIWEQWIYQGDAGSFCISAGIPEVAGLLVRRRGYWKNESSFRPPWTSGLTTPRTKGCFMCFIIFCTIFCCYSFCSNFLYNNLISWKHDKVVFSEERWSAGKGGVRVFPVVSP